MAEAAYNVNVISANLTMLKKKWDAELDNFMQQTDLTQEEEKFLSLRENEQFLKDIVESEDEAAVGATFKKHGVELSDDEVKEFVGNVGNTVNKVMNASEEMSDDELAEVAGGSWSSFWKKAKKYVAAAVVGAIAGAVVGGLMVVTGGTAAPLAAIAAGAAIGAAKGAATGAGGMIATDLWKKYA
ncbi:MAG: Blp family class II bacteriocin [Lachnospiraceae bacterium]|nr:Blp family class II bacteriocin [Lachnospiraceae bacterium]